MGKGWDLPEEQILYMNHLLYYALYFVFKNIIGSFFFDNAVLQWLMLSPHSKKVAFDSGPGAFLCGVGTQIID